MIECCKKRVNLNLISLAHSLWKEILLPGDFAIDATCGNGYDTLALAKILDGKGKIVSYDIQEEALMSAETLLKKNLSCTQQKIISLRHNSHEFFEEKNAKLIVYNLGYLPGGDKSITTRRQPTLNSLKAALPLIHPQGAISILSYVGHEEGEREERALRSFIQELDNKRWVGTAHCLLNRQRAPILFFIQSMK